MLQVEPFESDSDHVVSLKIDGPISSEELTSAMSVIDKRLERFDKLRLYVEIHSLGGTSASTLFHELRDNLKHWNRFDKMAIVSDVEGIRTATTVVDKLAPGMDLHTFRFDERETAQSWVV